MNLDEFCEGWKKYLNENNQPHKGVITVSTRYDLKDRIRTKLFKTFSNVAVGYALNRDLVNQSPMGLAFKKSLNDRRLR